MHDIMTNMDKLKEIFNDSISRNVIENNLYQKYNVKKGLRNEDGTGVLVGLTRICDVVGYQRDKDKKIDIEGKLYFRGYELQDLCNNMLPNYGFEEIAYLILFGKLPSESELKTLIKEIANNYQLPDGYIPSYILRYPSINVMNKIQRSLLMLYSTDPNPDDTSLENIFSQGISIVSKLIPIAIYAYQAKNHFFCNESLYIHHIDESLSIAENILRLLRPDKQYSQAEVAILNLLLIIHIDHGVGNNSTFTNSVIASTDTDIYSCFSASVGSLKGRKHGGANISSLKMMKAVIAEIGVYATDEEIENIILRILDKDFFDNSGLVYGIGHAVYTKSDPRARILVKKAESLAIEKNQLPSLNFYKRFESIAKKVLFAKKHKNICANVDFYSGLIYEMLKIPEDLYTPLFVISRSWGWLAHDIENKLYANKIIRPAGKYVGEINDYIKMEDRK